MQNIKDNYEKIKAKALKLVQQNGTSIQDLPLCFKSDPDIVLAAIENNEIALYFCDIKIIENKDLMRKLSPLIKSHFSHMKELNEAISKIEREDDLNNLIKNKSIKSNKSKI